MYILIYLNFVPVKQDIAADNEEGLKIKEQAILELGDLLAETQQAEGE